MTKDEFIQKSTEIHNGKYDYSKVNYINTKTKVCIICPKHGEFWQDPYSHSKGHGCPSCAGNHRRTTEEFIREIKELFPDANTIFDKVVFKRRDAPVTLVCPIHGEYEKLATLAFQSIECPECQKIRLNKERAKTKEQFIADARLVHGDKYEYDKVVYKKALEKVCITCPEHGDFWQTPNNHLKGKGCPYCNRPFYYKTTDDFIHQLKNKFPESETLYDKVVYKTGHDEIILICPKHGEFKKKAIDALRSDKCPICQREDPNFHYTQRTTEDFIKDAIKKHGDKYDYSKVEYSTCNDKVCIICPDHGEFWQTPMNHLRGANCPTCGNKNIWEKRKDERMTTEKFIKRSNEVHNNKYDYSKTTYSRPHEKVTIICKKHGKFTQEPYSHMKGAGCPVCYSERSTSDNEILFRDFIAELYRGVIKTNDRTIIRPREIDIYLPEINVAFEYNGLYWHSAEKLHNNLYHQMKMKMCLEKGVTLYQFFEDEWLYKPDAVKSFVKRVLEVPMIHIEANACNFLEINKYEAEVFIQNDALVCNNIEYNVVYGFYFENVLQSVALVNETDDYVEIMGVHDRNETIVDGAFDRVVSELKCLYSSKIMYVRVDRRLDNVQKYLNKGFVFVEEFLPDYNYVVRDFRIPKNNIEEFLENNERVLKIYDCGAERLRLVN